MDKVSVKVHKHEDLGSDSQQSCRDLGVGLYFYSFQLVREGEEFGDGIPRTHSSV